MITITETQRQNLIYYVADTFDFHNVSKEYLEEAAQEVEASGLENKRTACVLLVFKWVLGDFGIECTTEEYPEILERIGERLELDPKFV